jgi:hypothetical protein
VAGASDNAHAQLNRVGVHLRVILRQQTTLIDGIGPTDFMIDARLYSGVLAALLLEIGVRRRLARLRGWFGGGFRAG